MLSLLRSKISDGCMSWPAAHVLHVTVPSDPRYAQYSLLSQSPIPDYLFHIQASENRARKVFFQSISLILT